jgi:hypothetical protein
MNNLPPNTNLVTLSSEWDMMEDYESRNRLRSTSNNNTQEPTTRFHARALPQNTLGDGMNNPHEAVSIANLNINYNRLGGPPDRFSLDKLHLPTPPDSCEGKARDSANSHSHSVANLETNGEFLDSLSKSMENLSTNETTLTGSIPRLSSLTNGRSPAMGMPYPYASMQSPLTNGPMNATNAMFPSNATFRDHKNGEPDSEMRHYYPYGYTGSYPISTPSRGQPPQPFPGSMGNAYTDNGSTLGTAQNSSNNNKGYSYINGQTNSQKYAVQSATTFSLGEPEASEPPQHISNAIVIKNIPFGVKIEQLKRLMEDLKLPTPYAFNYHFDKENLFRGLAFANFHHDWEATEVIKVLNGYVISERALRVELKIMLKPGERETAEREKRMKRGQLQEQHKPVSPDMIESLPRLFNPESPIPTPVCSYASGGQQQHDIPRQRRLPASVFDYTTSGNLAPSLLISIPSSSVLTITILAGDDRQTSATCPQRQAPQRQPNGPSSYPGSQSPSWRPIREQPRPTGQYPRADSSQYGIIGDRMLRPLGGTGPSQV